METGDCLPITESRYLKSGVFCSRRSWVLASLEAIHKFEIRSTKHETNTKSEFSNVQNVNIQRGLPSVLVIGIFVIRICLGFRYSDLGFEAGGISQLQLWCRWYRPEVFPPVPQCDQLLPGHRDWRQGIGVRPQPWGPWNQGETHLQPTNSRLAQQ